MEKKHVIMLVLCIAIATMAIVYAAFQTTLTVTTNVTGAGLDVKLSCSCSAGTAGLSGATAPTATCTPASASSTTTGTMTATLYQPGDSVTCTYTITNNSSFRVKTTSAISCGTLASPFTSSNSALASGTIIAANGGTTTFTVTMGYLSSITSQPSTTSGTISCTVPLGQVA